MAGLPLVAIASGTIAASHTTGAFTPTANTRLLCFPCAYLNSASAVNKPGVTSSAGLTFDEATSATATTGTSGSPSVRTTTFLSSNVGASPASQTLTSSATSATGTALGMLSVYNDEITGVFVQQAGNNDNTNGDPAITFGAAPNPYNLVALSGWYGGGNAVTGPAGFLEIGDVLVVTARQLALYWSAQALGAGPHTQVTVNAKAVAVGVELEANLTAPCQPNPIMGGSGTASATTPSFNPPASPKTCRIFVKGYAQRTGGSAAAKPTISDNSGGAITWTELGSIKTATANPDLYLIAWISNDLGASPPTGLTVTVASASANQTMLVCSVIPADTTDGTARQTASNENSAGDPSYSFGSAPLSTNLEIVAVFGSGSAAFTPPTGRRYEHEGAGTGTTRIGGFYTKGSAAQSSNAFASTNTKSLALAIELNQAAAAATKSMPPTRPALPLTLR